MQNLPILDGLLNVGFYAAVGDPAGWSAESACFLRRFVCEFVSGDPHMGWDPLYYNLWQGSFHTVSEIRDSAEERVAEGLAQ